MDQSLKQFTKTALDKISQTKSNPELEKLRVQFLGRKGKINQLFSQIKNIPPEKRGEYGQNLNSLKKNLESAFKKQTKLIKTAPLEKISLVKNSHSYSLAKIGHLHPISLTERKLNQLFSRLGFSIYDGPEIETDQFCFENLNVPPDHPARDMQDSIYIQKPQVLLRTQTSSIEARLLSLEKPPFKAVFPGRVYRNEKVNKSNHFIFHQYQAVVVDKNVNLKDLFGCIDLMFKTLYGPKVVVRYRNKYYPEVEPGVGPDMQCFSCHGHGCSLCKGAGWIEMGGAGIIHPNVLKKAGINPKKWRGFAFGMGLDRWTMANYAIKDIRTLLGGNLAYKPNQI